MEALLRQKGVVEDQVDLVQVIDHEKAKLEGILKEEQVSVFSQLHLPERKCIETQDHDPSQPSVMVEQQQEFLQNLMDLPGYGEVEMHKTKPAAILLVSARGQQPVRTWLEEMKGEVLMSCQRQVRVRRSTAFRIEDVSSVSKNVPCLRSLEDTLGDKKIPLLTKRLTGSGLLSLAIGDLH